LREYVEIIHAALAGEPVAYDGQRYRLPLPGGEGKALRLAMAPTSRVPIYLATLGPKMLALTGELADGWLGTSFIPEAADQVMPHLLDGARRRGRTLADLDLQVMTTVDVDDDVERVITRHRRGVAFYVGAMGSEGQNFYKNAYERAGWGEVVAEVQSLWLGGNRAAAVAAMPDEFVLATQCIGTPAMVRSRLSALAKVGISTLRIAPIGQGLDEQLHHLEAVLDLAKDVQ
jgi:alkanesulfonate monooxygenase SsuD/methylene tetrahydromethanopterin reductase-like flavin-dependent oxidoreductase (luciferase family)